MIQIIDCPNCKRKIKAILRMNRWVKWIAIYCEGCGYRNNIENLDFIQPDSPFFEAIYGNNPIAKQKMEEKYKKLEKENLKDKREIGLKIKEKKGLLKPYEVEDIIKYARDKNLE